jgi:hypothetical protein
LRRNEEAVGLDCRAHDLLDPVVTEKFLPTLAVGDKNEFHRPFRGGEDRVGFVGLLASGDKPHVPRRDPDEGRHVVVAADRGRIPRVSSKIGSIKTIRRGVSCVSEEERAWRTALSISSGSYSGLAIHEPVQRYRNESVVAPKISSSGNVEQYEIPSGMEQLRGLPSSSMSDWNVRSSVCCRVGMVAHWLASLSLRPWRFTDLALGWYRARSLRRSWLKASGRAR